MTNAVQQSNIFQDFVMNQLKGGSVEKGGSLDDLTDGLQELIHRLKNKLYIQAPFNLDVDSKSFIEKTITEGIEGKNRYYSSTVAGRISSFFQRTGKKFFGCVGYRTPIERAQAFLNSIAVEDDKGLIFNFDPDTLMDDAFEADEDLIFN